MPRTNYERIWRSALSDWWAWMKAHRLASIPTHVGLPSLAAIVCRVTLGTEQALSDWIWPGVVFAGTIILVGCAGFGVFLFLSPLRQLHAAEDRIDDLVQELSAERDRPPEVGAAISALNAISRTCAQDAKAEDGKVINTDALHAAAPRVGRVCDEIQAIVNQYVLAELHESLRLLSVVVIEDYNGSQIVMNAKEGTPSGVLLHISGWIRQRSGRITIDDLNPSFIARHATNS